MLIIDNLDVTITRLSRTGIDNVIGHLDGGLNSWVKAGKPTERINSFAANNHEDIKYKLKDRFTIDVREDFEQISNGLLDIENLKV